MSLHVVILAAGQGTRMKSRLPKVLHALAGKPMLHAVIDSAAQLQTAAFHIVIGHGADLVKSSTPHERVNWVLQDKQLGTGHAVAQALPSIPEDATVAILYGDVPLVKPDTLRNLIQHAREKTLALLTVKLANPTGYGRIVRDNNGFVQRIVEQKDASAEELRISEVNTGILAVAARDLKRWIPALSANNAQGEYYLTDIIAMAVADGYEVAVAHPTSEQEVQGVNNRQQLAELERWHQCDLAKGLMAAGVTLADPARIDVRGTLDVGQDIFIDVNSVFEGRVTLGDNVSIGPNCLLQNATIQAGAVIHANSVIEDAVVGPECSVGPFARLRPGTRLAKGAKVGNFVETKKAIVGEGSKINHLSYVGDAVLGKDVNVGAGTITCNYDGVNKFQTTLGDGVFVGSNSALVAPVTVGDNATIGAGSTVTKDVPAGQLAIARERQRNLDNWNRPTKKPKA